MRFFVRGRWRWMRRWRRMGRWCRMWCRRRMRRWRWMGRWMERWRRMERRRWMRCWRSVAGPLGGLIGWLSWRPIARPLLRSDARPLLWSDARPLWRPIAGCRLGSESPGGRRRFPSLIAGCSSWRPITGCRLGSESPGRRRRPSHRGPQGCPHRAYLLRRRHLPDRRLLLGGQFQQGPGRQRRTRDAPP